MRPKATPRKAAPTPTVTNEQWAEFCAKVAREHPRVTKWGQLDILSKDLRTDPEGIMWADGEGRCFAMTRTQYAKLLQ